jgi:hypothetical protein
MHFMIVNKITKAIDAKTPARTDVLPYSATMAANKFIRTLLTWITDSVWED